jgi:hypothetical protein
MNTVTNTPLQCLNNGKTTNFTTRRENNEVYARCNKIEDLSSTFFKRYYHLFDVYTKNIIDDDIHIVNASVKNGCINWDTIGITKLSIVSTQYLKNVEAINSNIMDVTFKRGNAYIYCKLSTCKQILTNMRSLAREELKDTPEQLETFLNWIKYVSPTRYIHIEIDAKRSENATQLRSQCKPMVFNYNYYSQLTASLVNTDNNNASLMIMEILTGRRIGECDIDNFTWMNPKDATQRAQIRDYYTVKPEHDSIIDVYNWVMFSGQTKMKREEAPYPIPLLFKVSQEMFEKWGKRLKNDVESGNKNKGITQWSSKSGGLQVFRNINTALYTRLLPTLEKGHNFRAIYGRIVSHQLNDKCLCSDPVKLMSLLMGHIDTKSTENYRIVQVEHTELSVDETKILTEVAEIVEGRGLQPVGNTSDKPKWSKAVTRSYTNDFNTPLRFKALKIVDPDTDFSKLRELEEIQYKTFMSALHDRFESVTGLTFNIILKRYNEVDFSIIYNLAKEVRRYNDTATKVTLKKKLDLVYKKMLSTGSIDKSIYMI